MSGYEKSCGAVVYTVADGERLYIIIKSRGGVFGFPKGHVEGGESERETALREVREETALHVELVDGFRAEDGYMLPGRSVRKDVVYFLGYFEGQKFEYQKKELSGIELLPFDEALARLKHSSTRRILREADAFLQERE